MSLCYCFPEKSVNFILKILHIDIQAVFLKVTRILTYFQLSVGCAQQNTKQS